MGMRIGEAELKWLGHAGFFIKNHKAIYIDPFNIKDGSEKADVILITHSHYDHCSFADLSKIVQEGTRVIAPPDCQSMIAKLPEKVKIEIVEPGQEVDLGKTKILAVPSYNIDKHFHPKDEQWVGYVVKMDGVIIYHSGDTDVIPEMQKLTGYKQAGKEFVALLPVGGRFTMSAEEAFEAAKIVKPTIAVPMHWGSIIGERKDAEEFVALCSDEGLMAEIMEKE